MPDRYYVAEPITAEHARLVGEEAHHLLHVMRARAGDELVVFDGSGAEWQGRVSQIDRNAVDVALLARREIDRELSFELTLATALPKGDRQRWLVEKAVELGVRRLTPLVTERGVAQPTDKALTRLRRAVIEASKQCGRNRLMEVSQPVVFFDYLAAPSASGIRRALADPSGNQSLGSLLEIPDGQALRGLAIAVGPEGGFSDDEVATAVSRGWPTFTLGPRVLRVETAAMAIAAALAALTMGGLSLQSTSARV